MFDLLQVYGHVPRTQTNLAVATFIQSLAPLNSAANPLIYCLFSTSVGRALRPGTAQIAQVIANLTIFILSINKIDFTYFHVRTFQACKLFSIEF